MYPSSIHLTRVSEARFTHLFARISEEDDVYVVLVKLRNEARSQPDNTVWGEEIADSIEAASEMIAALAAQFSIPSAHITLEIRMDNASESTRH